MATAHQRPEVGDSTRIKLLQTLRNEGASEKPPKQPILHVPPRNLRKNGQTKSQNTKTAKIRLTHARRRKDSNLGQVQRS